MEKSVVGICKENYFMYCCFLWFLCVQSILAYGKL